MNEPHDADIRAAETVARWMDRRWIDPILGLVLPGAGDLISSGLGLYPIVLAWRRGAPRTLIARMFLNLAVDMLGGSIPVVGDIWDFFFHAHSRNLDLLRARHTGVAVRSNARDGLVVVGAVLVFVAALAVPITLLVLGVRAGAAFFARH